MRRRDIDDPSKVAAVTFNMTPMIDVVFQLIVVFLCSMKFRTLDQKLEARLPRDESHQDPTPAPPEYHPVLTVRLQRRSAAEPTRVFLGGSRLGETGEGEALWDRLRTAAAAMRTRSPDLVGEIDASPEVEHGDVVRALDGFVAAGLASVKFRGAPPPRR